MSDAVPPLETPPSDAPVIRTIAMPADTNPDGDIFGGWLLAQMDLGAGVLAIRRARGRCATVSVDGMTFLRPVKVGDEVSIFAHVLRVGRTSIAVSVSAWRRSRATEESSRVTQGIFTFVAIDQDGRPRLVPPLEGNT